MPESEREVIIPVEQAVVPFYDRTIIAVRLPDGRIAAVLSFLCDALQLAAVGQARRIRADDVLADQLLFAQVQTEGGPQAMDVLTAWAIPAWLQGIKLGKVAPEKRPAILAFKREAADVLYRHFSQQRALAAPSGLVPAEPVAEPTRPAQALGVAAGLCTTSRWRHGWNGKKTWRRGAGRLRNGWKSTRRF
jgi:hypothetical protein